MVHCMLMRITIWASVKTVTLKENTADYVGALYDVKNNTLSFSGNSSFKGSTSGGSLSYISSS